ncbi:MAG: hypothetical protein NTX75_09725 [Proteobacteria bacterium]|nr:hypothetical protein [Pseudomonadota bacterium]
MNIEQSLSPFTIRLSPSFLIWGYDVEGVMSVLVSYMRRPDSVSEEIAATFAAIIEIFGKSIRTLLQTI